MSDYPNPNIHRSDGISARGLLITLGVVAFIFVLLAALGSGTVPQDPNAQGAAPIAEETAPAAPAVTE